MSVAAFRSAAAARYTVVEAPSGLAYRLRPFNTLATIAAGRPSLVSAALDLRQTGEDPTPESLRKTLGAVADLFSLAVVSTVAAFKAPGGDDWQDLKVTVDGAEGTIGIEELPSGDFDALAAAAVKAAGLSDLVSLRPRDSGSP